MQVTEGEEAARREYDGLTYYFCSKACARKFQQNPESYVGTAMPVEQLAPQPIAAPGGQEKTASRGAGLYHDGGEAGRI